MGAEKILFSLKEMADRRLMTKKTELYLKLDKRIDEGTDGQT